ncbi:DEAD/DEAH box helicase family protein [bacterium]|nr:DEAD/DEAH box helicase family protein [bacterium]
MDRIAQNIKNRLSLRPPQTDSLEILNALCDVLDLSPQADLEKEMGKVKKAYPIFSEFEREFPSLCFALATGVGKTRLMGAFVAYLYLAKSIKNFFVLAPNLTIYNKLIEDFGNPAHPKYVFKGIGEFVNRQPRIITGDNYLYASQNDAFQDEIHINIFNISKINAETRGGAVPRIKRLSEYLGESYFNYLASLDDLVLLMDESHHYRADRGMQVINELKPLLGLEVTATPKVERQNKAIKFKNVVYEYALAKAIKDGFVKEPAVATRKDFNPDQFSNEELDRIKVEDGIRIHEETKVSLAIYAKDNQLEVVKPFVLVVAKDTEHASELKELIRSPGFFDGYYADKVMEIHSNQRGSEKEDNIQNLLTLEDPGNKTEIVIHVNMLKEGWDVNNLYTIIPLRAAASTTLREQTIGRGLRLPYGKRTGESAVDKLTIVAHDKFQEIVDAANLPDSIIRKENIIEIDETALNQTKQVITAPSILDNLLDEEAREIGTMIQGAEKQKAQESYDAKKQLLYAIPQYSKIVKKVADLTTKEMKTRIIQDQKQRIENDPQQQMFADQLLQQIEAQYDETVKQFIANIIEIPRITIQQQEHVESGFHDFDLDVSKLNYQPGSEEIVVHTLRNGEVEIIESNQGRLRYSSIENVIVAELMNYPEIDYDEHADLLFKLASQAVEKFKSYIEEDKIANVVIYHKRDIGKYIQQQLMDHFYYKTPAFTEPVVRPFTRIVPHNLSKYSSDQLYDYRDTITPTNTIPSKVFTGFKKSCHQLYKFDSKTEKDFAVILEQDPQVVKWLRPAPNQFHIYYNPNYQRYQPDFVAETEHRIYLIETKKAVDVNDPVVVEKSHAALLFCTHATNHAQKHGSKLWKYVVIPHDVVKVNMGFDVLVKEFEFRVE